MPTITVATVASSTRLRLMHCARRIHALGEAPLYHLLVELPPTGQLFSQPAASALAAHTGIPDARVGVVIGKIKRTPDRAAVVTVAVLQMVASVPLHELQQALENLLRDEFSDAERQARADKEPADA